MCDLPLIELSFIVYNCRHLPEVGFLPVAHQYSEPGDLVARLTKTSGSSFIKKGDIRDTEF